MDKVLLPMWMKPLIEKVHPEALDDVDFDDWRPDLTVDYSARFDPRQLEPCIQIPCPPFMDHRFEDGDD